MKLAYEYLRRHLPEGEYETSIEKVETFVPSSGTQEFIKYKCVDEEGRSADATFSLGDIALWRLVKFIEHCGLTDEDLRHFDIEDIGHHECLVGRRIKIHVQYKNHKDEVTEFPIVRHEKESERPQPAFDRAVLPKAEFVEAATDDGTPF